MTNTLLLKKSGTSGETPTTSELSHGELALNYADGKLFFKNNAGTPAVVELLSQPSGNSGAVQISGGSSLSSASGLSWDSGNSVLKVPGLKVNNAFTLPTSDGTANQVLQTNGSGSISWGSVGTTLGGLSDTTITSVADNDIIAYDSTSSKYTNQSASEAGLATASHTHTESEITDLSHYTHPNTAGNKHIPSGGSAGQFLKYDGANSGTAVWATPSYTTDTTYDLLVPALTTAIRLDPSSGSNDDITITGGTNVTVTRTSGTELNIASEDTTYTSSDFSHDSLSGVTANEHIDWTTDQGTTNIHSGNYTTYTHPNHSGDVTSSGDGATTIGANKVTHAKYQQVATDTIIGRTAASAGDVKALSASEVRGIINVANGAEVNVQSDWNATTGDALILNKPTIPSGNSIIDWTTDQGVTNIHSGNYTDTTYSVGDGGLTEKNFTTTLKTKLDGIATSANNYSHPTSAGNKHIPSGGSSGQFLKYSSSGTAVWATPPDNNTQLSTEQVQDIVGGMFSSNTETRISATYNDTGGKINLVVDDMNDSYSLPTASSSVLGGVKIGNGVSISNGTISVSTNYVTSNSNDTMSGILTMSSSSQYAITMSGSHDGKILLASANSPYIRFREGTADKGYLQWHKNGYMYIRNQEDNSSLRIKDTIDFSVDGTNYNNILHAGNYSSYALPLSGGTLTGALTGTSATFTGSGSNYIKAESTTSSGWSGIQMVNPQGNSYVISDTSEMRFYVGSGGSTGIKATLQNNGKIALSGTAGGVQTPDQVLHVWGNIAMERNTGASNQWNEWQWFISNTDGAASRSLCNRAKNYEADIQFLDNGSISTLRIDHSANNVLVPNGRLGVKTTNPNYDLTVQGNIGYSGTITDYSDRRLKENIEDANLDTCYANVKNLKLRRFRFMDGMLDEKQDRAQIGWIAQEVEEVFPKSVFKVDYKYNQVYEDYTDVMEDEVKWEDGELPTEENTLDEIKAFMDLHEFNYEDTDTKQELLSKIPSVKIPKVEETSKRLVSEDTLENCYGLSDKQIIASMYGAIQKLISKVEALESQQQ